MSLGFKNFKFKEAPLMVNAIHLKYELKYAFQRAWRGYDDNCLYSLNSNLDELIPEVLIWLRENHHGSPMLEGFDENTCHQAWDEILDSIIYHFKESNDDTCSEVNEYEKLMKFNFKYKTLKNKNINLKPCIRIGFAGKDLIDPNPPELKEKYHKRLMEIERYKTEHHKKAYELVAQYIDYLWD